MRHFWPELRRQRSLIAGSFIALVAGVAMQLMEPWPLKFVLDYLLGGAQDSAANFPSGLGYELSADTLLIAAGLAYVIIVTARATAEYLQTLGFAVIGNRVVSQVRSKLYRHLQSLPMAFHNKSRHGDLLIRVVGDIKLLRDASVTAVLPLVGSTLVLVGMLGVMLILNWRLGLVALAILPLFSVASIRIGHRVHRAARQQRERESAISAMAAEAMASMQVVQALSLEQHFEGSFTSEEKRNVADEIKTRRLSAQLERSTDVLIAIATALVLWHGGRLALAGSISPGDLIVFLTYLKRGFRPLQDFAKYVARLAKATAAGERIVELLEVTPHVCDRANAQPVPPLRGRLSFEQVRFHYDAEKPVFQNLTCTIDPGKTVAIVGPSGIGKSSIFNLLMRFYDPVAGRILIDGYDIRDFTIDSLRQQISIVLQDTVLFAANVYDNIAFGAANVSRERIEQAARDANADSFIRALPHGYDTMLGERGVNLSHGQRQRIAIARAAVRNSPLLLLDEPTTALDQKNKRFVLDAIKRLAAGRTTLWVTHDLREAVEADVICLIDSHGVVEHGTHEELIASGGIYAQMFRDQLVGRSSVASGAAATTA